MDEDVKYIKETLRGDKRAYAHLVDKYKAYVYTLLVRQLASPQLAEEAAQDVFLKAYRGLGKFRFGSSFSTWIYRIAYRVGLDYIKKRDHSTMSMDEVHELGIQISSNALNADDQLYRADVSLALNAAIDQLDQQSADVIRLFYLNEMSISEIEEITGLNKNNIKIKLHRGRKKLRTHVSVLLNENRMSQ